MTYLEVKPGSKAQTFHKYVNDLNSTAFIQNNSFIQFKDQQKLNTNFNIDTNDYINAIRKGNNVSLTTGIKYGSNIIAVDLDTHKWTEYNTHIWIKTFGSDYINKFNTYTQKTPSGGIHLFFQYHQDIYKNSTSEPYQIDIRSNGGVIAMNKSFSNKYNKYYTILNNTSIKPLPDNIKEFILKYLYNNTNTKKTLDKKKNIIHNNVITTNNINNNDSFISTYNYFITEQIFKNIVLDKLPIKYFNEYDSWLKLLTCMKYMNLKDLCKSVKMLHRKQNSKWQDDNYFEKQWNGIKNNDLKIVEYIFKLVRKKKYLNLFRYKST